MAAENGAPKTLTLRSNDGEEFSVPESAAVLSVTIRNMVDDGCADGVIPLGTVDGRTLAEVIAYLNKHAADSGATDEEKKKFDEELLSGKDIEALSAVVLAANYLNISALLEIVADKIAGTMENKSVGWVREQFGIDSDFTAEEEDQLRQEDAWAHEGVDD